MQLAVPIALCAEYRLFVLAALLFAIAAITDYLDGFFAKRRGNYSEWGKVADPVADKLACAAAAIGLLIIVDGVWFIMLPVVGITVYDGIMMVLRNRSDVPSQEVARWKTGFLMVALLCGLAFGSLMQLTNAGLLPEATIFLNAWLLSVTVTLLWLAMILAAVSAFRRLFRPLRPKTALRPAE